MSEPLIEAVLGEMLLKKGYKLAVAESCTGGLIGHRVTNIPGSSAYYLGSVTAYAYEAKERLLGVRHETLVKYGAVSAETVLEMAYGIRAALAADFPLEQTIGVSVSGIAGPGGGMPGKPVGLVWMAISAQDFAWSERYYFQGNREQVKAHSAQQALENICRFLNGDLS